MLAAFRERMLVPRQVIGVRGLQVAIGLVGAGQDIAIVRDSLQAMMRTGFVYRPIEDRQGVWPIIFRTRAMDRSQELADMLALICEIYDGGDSRTWRRSRGTRPRSRRDETMPPTGPPGHMMHAPEGQTEDRFAVLGHSVGGGMALHCAARITPSISHWPGSRAAPSVFG